MGEWQPIESAPRDGTWVIVAGVVPQPDWEETQPYGSGHAESPEMAILRWGAGKWRDQWDDFYGPEFPAMWMPLPLLPRGGRIMTWADEAKSTIYRVHVTLSEGATLADRTKAIDAAYPFGNRECFPYKAWLKERRAYLCKYGYAPANKPDAFADWQRDPETGRPIIP